jgi:hypothetical protein
VLKDVLENITLYSTLDIEDRKTLIRQATSSYADYMITMLDSLPTPVTSQERSDKSSIPEIDVMTDAKVEVKETDEVARSGDAVEETSVEEAAITRADVETIVKDVLAAIDATRSESSEAESTEDTTEVVERSEEKVDPLDTIAAAITAMATRMDSMEAAATDAAKVAAEQDDALTVTRSEEETTEEVQRSKNVSPFVGMFGSKLHA